MQRSSKLVEHFVSTCRNCYFTSELGHETFWGFDVRQYRYFWLSPGGFFSHKYPDLPSGGFFEFDYSEDMIDRMKIKFIPSISTLSFHCQHYPEHGLAEYNILPLPLSDLSFTWNSNLINSPSFFILMIEPPLERPR